MVSCEPAEWNPYLFIYSYTFLIKLYLQATDTRVNLQAVNSVTTKWMLTQLIDHLPSNLTALPSYSSVSSEWLDNWQHLVLALCPPHCRHTWSQQVVALRPGSITGNKTVFSFTMLQGKCSPLLLFIATLLMESCHSTGQGRSTKL